MPARPATEDRGRSPADFAAILAGADPLFLVGGQAVNLWALCYPERTGHLAPFVSRDIDVLGDRDTLSRIAKTAGVPAQFFPLRPPTNEIGIVMVTGTDGSPLPVEVLSHVHGIGNEELCRPTYTLTVGEGGVKVHVPGPVALLQAKIANAADLPQAGRQDGRHVHILTQVMPGYLGDLLATVTAGRLDQRGMLDLLERLLTVIASRQARRVMEELGICRQSLFAELNPPLPAKLHAFVTQRLPRILGT